MSRRLRHHLAAALQPHHPAGYAATTAVLQLPAPLVRSAPVWTPGPSYVELLTATVWAQPIGDGTAHAVVRTVTGDGTSMLSQGNLAALDVVGLGGLTDKPHRISGLTTGLITEPVAADHPACAYHHWVSAIEQRLEQRYEDMLGPG